MKYKVIHDRKDLIDKWQKDMDKKRERESDLNFIFNEMDLHNVTAASIKKLKDMSLGKDFNMWGDSGEGYIWYQNARSILKKAAPYIEKHDIDGWLKFCEEFKKKRSVTYEIQSNNRV